jgi:hypothetical protein
MEHAAHGSAGWKARHLPDKHFLINGEGTVILTANDITSPTSRQSLTGLYYASTEAGVPIPILKQGKNKNS